MILKSNAKINLGLYVTERRADGYHNLESLFLPIPWFDEIRLEKSEKFSFTSEGIPIPGTADHNLCRQAFDLIKAAFGIGNVHIHLKKNIPIGAGLGGGSSNASTVLLGLNKLFELNLNVQRLESLAQQLGSDCPFFIRNQAAYVTGTGNQFNYEISLGLNCKVLLVHPGIHIATQQAFSGLRPKPASFDLRSCGELAQSEWKDQIQNDFEPAVLNAYPELAKLKANLYRQGAFYVSMSGSGSSFFAFFKEDLPKLDFDSTYLSKQFELSIP